MIRTGVPPAILLRWRDFVGGGGESGIISYFACAKYYTPTPSVFFNYQSIFSTEPNSLNYVIL